MYTSVQVRALVCELLLHRDNLTKGSLNIDVLYNFVFSAFGLLKDTIRFFASEMGLEMTLQNFL